MPTYEYRCVKCGHRFEREQSITAEPLKRCPECRSQVQRVITGGSGFLFKGDTSASALSDDISGDSSCCGQNNPCSDPKRCCGR